MQRRTTRTQTLHRWRLGQLPAWLAIDFQTEDIGLCLSHRIFRVEVGYAEAFAAPVRATTSGCHISICSCRVGRSAGGGCSIVCLHRIISRRGTVVDHFRVVVVLAKGAVVVLANREPPS